MAGEPELACESCGRWVSAEEVLEARARVRAFGLPSDAQRWQFLQRLGLADRADLADDLGAVPLCLECVERGLTWANVD